MRRWRLGTRGKLFLVSLALVALALTVTGVFLQRALRDEFEQRAEAELRRHARAVRAALLAAPSVDPDEMADRLGEAVARG